jgi:hypothetical protein
MMSLLVLAWMRGRLLAVAPLIGLIRTEIITPLGRLQR